MFGLSGIQLGVTLAAGVVIAGLGVTIKYQADQKEKLQRDYGALNAQFSVVEAAARANALAAQRVVDRCAEGNTLAAGAAERAEQLRSEYNRVLQEAQRDAGESSDTLRDFFRGLPGPGAPEGNPAGPGPGDAPAGPAPALPRRP